MDFKPDRPLGTDDRADDAIRRGGDMGVDVEMIAVGLGVDQETELIAAVRHRRLQLDQGPAGANVRLARDTRPPPLPSHPFLEANLHTLQAPAADLSLGADRPRPLAWRQPGQAMAGDGVTGQ